MTFMDSEDSRRGSRPTEVYDITGGTTVVRFCNQPVGVTHLSNFYQPAADVERRRLVREGVGGNPSDLDVKVVRSVLSGLVPGAPQPFTIVITRVQPGGYQRVFNGLITNNRIEGQHVSLLCVRKIESLMRRRLPALVLSQRCQRALYDRWCRVNRASFDQAATVVTVDGLEVEVDTVGANPDAWFQGGELWLGTEKRMITTQFGTLLTIDYPFAATLAGAVTLYAGCDKNVRTCLEKFANVANFQGAPQWQSKNPHVIRLDGIGVVSL